MSAPGTAIPRAFARRKSGERSDDHYHGKARFHCSRCPSRMTRLTGAHVIPDGDRYPPPAEATWCPGPARELATIDPSLLLGELFGSGS